ncbi:hypothetical protein KVR01_008781 [Diaporthe batatas]|uniref:uncharacterized protein n=1 Tax=Diaporthe batatas TaxID=748121 RepID=UPI001D03E585|nr:uncharacterized protein KVR01_008781 [Diaporthe batatas]KAG8161794.1 hypothetical protein KVR01_008781 [Diaporthe batatas]
MDPLSITTSAITLIQAAGSITSSLCGFINQCRGAENRITSLCDELEGLTSGLEAIDRTLKGRNALDLALVEDDLWKQCELALDDCHVTLNSLGVLVQKIKETVKGKAWAWRVKAVVNLNVYGGELAAFRDKVHKSNWALQTMLQTINVSLSLRNNASQEAILFELDRLKSSIDEALRASVRPAGSFAHRPADYSDARVARNLKNLAQAARHFHSAASSTASTIRDGSRNGAPWQTYPGADVDVSLMGDLPSFRRERVEEYVREWRQHRRSSSSGLTSPSFTPAGEHTNKSRPRRRPRSPRLSTDLGSPRPLSFSGVAETVTVSGSVAGATVEDEEDDDVEFERLFLDGLEELAKDRIKERDFDKAIEFLQEAMKREVGSKSDNEAFRNLQVQLALCYLLQRRWEAADPIITGLAKNKAAVDAVVCNLLHSMALVHLSLYHFDKALTVCREALMAKKKLLKKEKIDADDYAQTQGLLVMIYEIKGDWMHAEVYHSQIPANFSYKHPKDEVEFVTMHPNMLFTVLGDNLPDFSSLVPKVTPGLHELDGSGPDTCPTSHPTAGLKRNNTYNGNSPLKVKFAQQLRYEADTSKIAYVPESESSAESSPVSSSDPSTNGDADDEVSPPTSPESASPIKRRFSRMFGGRRVQQQRAAKPPASPTVDHADVPSPVQDRSALRSGWLNTTLGFKRSRNRLRKAHRDEELGGVGKSKEFKLLYMERMTTENVGQVKDPEYRRQYWSPDSIGNSDTSAHEMDADNENDPTSGDEAPLAPVSKSGGGHGVFSPCVDALPENGFGDDNFTFKNRVPYVDIRGHRRRQPQLEDVQEESFMSDEDTEADMPESNPIVELSGDYVEYFESHRVFDPYLCRSDFEVEEYWDTAMRAKPSGVKSCNMVLESTSPSGMSFGEHEARVMLMLGDEPPALTSQETIIEATSASDRPKPGRKVRRAAVKQVDPLLQSISSVLVSLADITDAEGRHAVKLDLEIMALEFKNRFRDGLVYQDLQRAISSLENDAITVPENDNNDSGYESMGSETETEDAKEKPSSTAKRAAISNPRSPVADDTMALHDRPEKPRTQASLVSESCDPPPQTSPPKQTSQPRATQEPRLPLRKRFSFENGQDEVVDANDAVAALRAAVQSGEADAVQSAIKPSRAHTRFPISGKIQEKTVSDTAAIEHTALGSPQVTSYELTERKPIVLKGGNDFDRKQPTEISEEERTSSGLQGNEPRERVRNPPFHDAGEPLTTV